MTFVTVAPEEKLRSIAYLFGMPRAGTTSLYHNLSQHPQIVVPFRRKTNYFCLHFDRPQAWFLDHFRDLQPGQIGIDTLTLHFLNRQMRSTQRVQQLNPDAKAILVVRRPGPFLWSAYKQCSTFDPHMPPFEAFLAGEYTLVEDGAPVHINLHDGDIAAHIREIQTAYDRNLLVISFDLLQQDMLRTLQTIETFLNLRPYFTAETILTERFNAHDRRNYVAIQRLARSRVVIALVKLLPRRLAIFLRGRFDRSSVANEPRQTGSGVTDIARQHFPSDDDFVTNLFAQSEIIQDGTPSRLKKG